jgi:hypothetical protein
MEEKASSYSSYPDALRAKRGICCCKENEQGSVTFSTRLCERTTSILYGGAAITVVSFPYIRRRRLQWKATTDSTSITKRNGPWISPIFYNCDCISVSRAVNRCWQ